MPALFTKDPDAVLDYAVDWSNWLASGEVISAAAFTAAGVTLDSESSTDTAVTAWISGGTAGTTATATCRITTDGGRTDDRTLRIIIRER